MAVQASGVALEYASSDLKADKEVVLAAMRKSINSVKYASSSISWSPSENADICYSVR